MRKTKKYLIAYEDEGIKEHVKDDVDGVLISLDRYNELMLLEEYKKNSKIIFKIGYGNYFFDILLLNKDEALLKMKESISELSGLYNELKKEYDELKEEHSNNEGNFLSKIFKTKNKNNGTYN